MHRLQILIPAALCAILTAGAAAAPSAQAIPPGPRDCEYIVNSAGDGHAYYYNQPGYPVAGIMHTGDTLDILANTDSDQYGYTTLPSANYYPYGSDGAVWYPYYSDAAPSVHFMDFQPGSCSTITE